MEDYLRERYSKATAQVEKELYNRVVTNFHYGQISMLIRNLFESLDVMIDKGKLMDIVKYIHKTQPLVLKPVMEEEKDENIS